MAEWSAESWVTFLGAVGVLIAAVAAAVVKVLQALRGIQDEVSSQTRQINRNADRLAGKIQQVEEECDDGTEGTDLQDIWPDRKQ